MTTSPNHWCSPQPSLVAGSTARTVQARCSDVQGQWWESRLYPQQKLRLDLATPARRDGRLSWPMLRGSHRPGIEPTTCKSQFQRPTAEPPRNTSGSISTQATIKTTDWLVGLLSRRYLKTEASRITKLDIQMFHDESWKSIYFEVKRSKVKVKRLCRSSDNTILPLAMST